MIINSYIVIPQDNDYFWLLILYYQYITYNFHSNYASQNYKFYLVDYDIAFFEYNDNIILNKFNTYPSALLSTIHLLKLMTLYQQTAFVFQLAMAWQSDELDLRVVSSIRCTDYLFIYLKIF